MQTVRPTLRDIYNLLRDKEQQQSNILFAQLKTSEQELNFLRTQTSTFSKKEAELRTQLASSEAQLQQILSVSKDGPITSTEERALRSIVLHKLNHSPDGLLHVQGERGRSKVFMPVTIAEVGSRNASKRALQQRSAAVEKVIELSSSPHAGHADVTAQQVSLIGRNPGGFAAAANQAGMKILGKVQLTPQALAAIKAELPTTMMYMLKRLFHSELGVDIFGPLDKLGRTLEPFKFTYECGTVDIDAGGTVQQVKFLRVTDVADVLRKTYLQLQEHQLLDKQASYKEPGLTRWMASGDKGGNSTKLLLQCLDTAGAHSTRHARLLAFFEGAKDCHGPVKAVFEPILSSLHDVIENIGDLQLTSGQHKIGRASLVHGGDWLYQASLLGLTGPNGDYFCSKCLIRLRDIRKGVSHSFSPHKRQCDDTMPSPITAPARTMQGIFHDHAEFITAGSPKGKAAAFKNCERPCIIKGNGAVIHHISCMPLHISLGLGTQALDIIEAEALKLDRQVKEAEGKASNELTAAYARRRQLAEELKEKTRGLEEQKEKDKELDFQLSHTSLAQAEVKKVQREKRLLAAQVKSTKNQLKKTEAALQEVDRSISEQQGPFQQALQKQLDKLQLERAKYHNRTLVGNDVKKLLKVKSMKAITDILKP